MRGGRLPFTTSAELADGLRGLARQEGATLFMLVLALTAALLHRDSGQERLILGANNANRNRPEIEPVLGCFLTQVPFPIDLAGDPSFRELLARVRQSALGSYGHQDLPFGQLVQAIGLARDPSRQPLIQTLVQVLDVQYSTAGSGEFASSPLPPRGSVPLPRSDPAASFPGFPYERPERHRSIPADLHPLHRQRFWPLERRCRLSHHRAHRH
jgi:hypothetical protein